MRPRRTLLTLFLMLGGDVVAIAGCASQPIPGGRLIRRDYQPRVLVAYTPEGEFEPGTRHVLVREGPSLAFFEQAQDGTGTLFERHWTDTYGDHFAVWESPWMDPGEAVEILIPADRARSAWRFVYEPGLYEVRIENGLPRPVPRMLIEASTELHPVSPTQPLSVLPAARQN